MLTSAAIYLYFVSISWHFLGCRSEEPGLCLLAAPETQCNPFCSKTEQSYPHLSTCAAERKKSDDIRAQLAGIMDTASEITKGQDQSKAQHADQVKKLNKILSSLSSVEDLRGRLKKIESQIAAQGNILHHAKETLKRKSVHFTKLGSRYFYVEHHNTLNWFAAQHFCRRLGGHLASLHKADIDALKIPKKTYWIGISDLAEEGKYVSSSNGKKASFLDFRPGEPNNWNNRREQDCLTLYGKTMDDDHCDIDYRFICQADDEN